MKKLITIVAVAGVLTALLLGNVTAAHASPITRGQAGRKAKDYLQYDPFSFKGPIEQLEYEGFTPAQALYGTRAVGL